jgi:phage/plasmid-associated DNA primase
LPSISWLYAFPESPLWNHLPDSGGVDVVDWIEECKISAEDIINSVELSKRVLGKSELTNHLNSKDQKSKQNRKIPQNKTGNLEKQFLPANTNKKNRSNSKISEYLDNSESEENLKSLDSQSNAEYSQENDNNFTEIGTHYTQMCINDLYSDKPWIAIEGQLYEWNGKFYQKASNGGERKRIADWCNTTPVKVGKGWKYAYATPTHIDNIWRWLLSYFSVKTEEVNPPGINCLNGVVKLNWSGNKVSWELIPHNPRIMYTYISEVNYDPSADSSEVDRMLSCLEPIQQELFLKTIACALDLKTVRKYRGREVRALLCQGHGNNGKDTLREATRMLFGYTLTNATVSDFAGYDNGRKFSLAKLEGASINWSSENSTFKNLDELQSLKVAITGEPLDIERKGVDEHEVMLNTVFLFNVNEVPNLSAAMEAIQSRWAVLSFNKTYKKKANPNRGEIEADSRFRYDPNFLQEKVCPALLNKLLNALTDVMTEGIDYSCTEEAIKNIQEETNHLWGFAREVGIDYQNGGRVYINDLWELLYKWYINNGTLEIVNENGKERKIWHEQVKRSDKNVKAPNQVYQRFSELFPKIKKERDNNYYSSHRGQFYLSGVEIKSKEIIEELISAPVKFQRTSQRSNSASISAAESLAKTNIEAIEAIYGQVSSKNNKSEQAIEKITNASVSAAINQQIINAETLTKNNIEAIYSETNSENYQSNEAIQKIINAPVNDSSAAINQQIINAETLTKTNIEAIYSETSSENYQSNEVINQIINAPVNDSSAAVNNFSAAVNESISKAETLTKTNIEAIYQETNSKNYESKETINKITSAPVDNFSAAINQEIINAETFTQNNIEAILSSSDEDMDNLNEIKTIIEIISALSPNDKALIRQALNNE